MYYDFVIASLFWNTKMLVRVYLVFCTKKKKKQLFKFEFYKQLLRKEKFLKATGQSFIFENIFLQLTLST